MNSAVKSLFTKYISHISGYIGHVLALVALIPTAQLDPRARIAVAIAGLVATASDHGYKAGSDALRSAVVAGLTSISQAAAAAKPAVLGVLFCLFTLPFVTGCAQLSAFVTKASAAVTSPKAQPFVKAGALAAITAAEQHGVSAEHINAVAKAALAADQGAGASLDAVKAVLDRELAKLNLPPGDLLAIIIVESEFNAYVQGQIDQDPTLAKAQAAAADIFQAVIDSTGG